MRVVVVGGTGLIGWHAAAELGRRGHSVVALARHEPPAGLLSSSVTFAAADVADRDAVRRVLEGAGGVVFAAGADFRVFPQHSAWEFFRRANLEVPIGFLKSALEAGARRAVFVTSYYHALRPELVDKHPYIRSRAESEQAALALVGDGLELSIVQPPFVMGRIPGRWWVSDPLARYARSRAPLLAPPGGSNWIAAVSLGEAIASALERGEPGRVYLVGDENLSWRELIERFARAVGRERPVRQLPPSAVRAGAVMLALWTRARRREAGVAPAAWASVLMSELYYDPTPAAVALGYRRGLVGEAIEAVAAGGGS